MAASLDGHALDGDDLIAVLAFLDDFEESSAPSEINDELQQTWQRDSVESLAPPLDGLDPSDMLELSPTLTASAQFQLPAAAQEESSTITDSSNNNGSTGSLQPSIRLSVRKPNQARNKRREELLLLRKQVAQLESQLTKLQIKERAKSSTCANGIHNTSTTPATHTSHNQVARRRVWKEIVRNQGERRLDAERENIRLKHLLGQHLQIAKSLQKHLRRAASSKATNLRFAASLPRPMSPPINQNDSDAALVNSLLFGLEQLYAEIDQVYTTSRLADSDSSRVESRMCSHGVNTNHSLELEVVGMKTLPFKYEATVGAAWDHYVFGIERIPSRLYYGKAPKVFLRASDAHIKVRALDPHFSTSLEYKPNRLILVSVQTHHVELKTRATSADFGVKQVIRRFTEQDRVVIVLQSYIDSINFAHELLPGVSVLEKGYVVIKKVATGSPTAAPLTLVQTCHVLTPMFSGERATSNENHPKLGAMVDFILAVAAANLRANHQMIEDKLLQYAMQFRSV